MVGLGEVKKLNEIYIIIGFLLLIVGMIDFLWIILWLESGVGLIIRCLFVWLWKGCCKISGDYVKVLSMVGLLLLCLMLVIWIILFWGGWFLIFLSDFYLFVEI